MTAGASGGPSGGPPPVPLQAATEVMRASPDGKRDVPVWWVVLGILAGILLLTLLILLMWKVRGGRT